MTSHYTDFQLAYRIAQEVHKAGGRTFFVGGYVRDQLLNRPNKDIDIEIHELTLDALQPILTQFGHLDERKVGESFGIFALRGYDLDIALPRREFSTGQGGHKDFIIDIDPFCGYEQAARRRDFTTNALMQDVLTGEILDYFGGLKDLENHIIRHVDDHTFVEDPLRVLRAAQFAARFNFTVDPKTIELSKQLDLTKLPHERIDTELDKALLKSDRPSVFFNTLRDMDQLAYWFPEVQTLIGCPQNPEHHPEGDVYTHTMNVIDNASIVKQKASDSRAFMLAALCHDFGKPATTEFNEKKQTYTSYGHDQAGVEPAQHFISRVYNHNQLNTYVKTMTFCHMMPHLLNADQSSQTAFMKMFDLAGNPQDLILLADCDISAYTPDIQKLCDTSQHDFLTEKAQQYSKLIQQPHVTGTDLQNLGYTDHKKYRDMLAFTHKLHLSGTPKQHVISALVSQFGYPEGPLEASYTFEDLATKIDEYESKLTYSMQQMATFSTSVAESQAQAIAALHITTQTAKQQHSSVEEYQTALLAVAKQFPYLKRVPKIIKQLAHPELQQSKTKDDKIL